MNHQFTFTSKLDDVSIANAYSGFGHVFLNISCLKLKGHATLFAITSLLVTSLRLIELNFNKIPLLKT